MKTTLIILGAVAVLLVLVYAYYGGFKKINFHVETSGGETMVYESVTGDYSQTPKYTDKIYYALLNDEKIETTKGIGIFYDNPKNVAKDQLRSEVGCLLENADSTVISKLSGRYKLKTLPVDDYIVAEFPMKGGLSFMVGILKVYPALNKFSLENGFNDSPITEIYDVPNKKITYRKEATK